MSTQPQAAKQPWLQKLPTLVSPEANVKDYISRHINPWSPRRRWNTQRAALNTWFYMGRQWIEPVAELVAGSGVYHFRELFRNGLGTFPRPVTNMIGPAVDNETARLGRKELVPDAHAGKNDPEWIQAARLARDLLLWEMSKTVWADKREEIGMKLCLEGMAIARSYWDENVLDTVTIAADGSAKCPHCERRYASRRVPRGFATIGMPTQAGPVPMFNKESLRDVELTGEGSAMHPKGIAQVELTHCPFCEMPIQLVDYMVSEEEAELDLDVFGRPMGMVVPKGEAALDVLSVHEFYPENTGIGIEPRESKIKHQMTVKPLEWIFQHWPELEGKIEPETPQELLRLNPLFNEPVFTMVGAIGGNYGEGGYTGAVEAYERHARVREVVIDPMPGIDGLEHGAHFVQVCNELVSRPLMVKVDTPDGPRFVPRVRYAFARFKRIPHFFYGRTFVDDLVPVQRRLNETDAQAIDLRERGKPTIWTPKNTELATKDENYGSLTVVEFDSPNPQWNPGQAIFPGTPLTGNNYFQERAQCLEDMQRIGAAADIEMGQAPGSVKTTSGLMLLSEEASQKRGPRERALAEMYETLWQHYLDLTWVFRKEESTYEVRELGSLYEKKSFVGENLLGDVKVKVDARAGYDQTLYNKEAAGEALQAGLYVVDTPVARDKILKLMKLPDDVNEEASVQIDRAEMAWSDFMKKGDVPTIDTTLNDYQIWFAVLGKRWMKDDRCYSKRKMYEWDAVLEQLAGWEQRAAEFEQLDAKQQMLYAQYPAEQWIKIYEQSLGMAKERFETQARAAALLGGPAPVEEFIPPPPADGFLPKQPEKRLYQIWRRMLPMLKSAEKAIAVSKALGADLPQAKRVMETDLLLQMFAVITTYKNLASGAAGAPPPAPGGAGAPAAAPAPAPAG
jgi:hypothetical protein